MDQLKTLRIRPMYKTELALMYEVHYSTFVGWLERIEKKYPEFDDWKGRGYLTPERVEFIITHLGKPPGYE